MFHLRLDFLKSLVVISIAAVLAMPAYIIFFLSPAFDRFLTENIEHGTERVARHLASLIAVDEINEDVSRWSLPEDLPGTVRKMQHDFGLLKVKIYSRQGEIVFSTDPNDIGQVTGADFFHMDLAQGMLFTKVVGKNTKSMDGQLVQFDVVESYVPLMYEGRFLGAFVIYYNIADVKHKFQVFVDQFYMTLFPITMGLLIAVMLSLLKVSRSIKYKAIADEKIAHQSAELKKMNMELSVLYEISRKRQQEVLKAQQERLDALEKVQEETAKSKEMRLNLLRHTVKAQEEERARIARELHDETAQMLTATTLSMEALKKYLNNDPEGEELINRAKGLCRDMSQSLYRLVHDLRPAQLDDLGLVPALKHLVGEAGFGESLEVSLKVTGSQQRLDPFIETVLYRAAQEALVNVIRHANTDKASVQIHFNVDKTILRVRDKGIGFNPEFQQQKVASGWGIAGMRERVEAINGTLLVQSSAGAGTLIEIIVPNREDAVENKIANENIEEKVE